MYMPKTQRATQKNRKEDTGFTEKRDSIVQTIELNLLGSNHTCNIPTSGTALDKFLNFLSLLLFYL